MTYRELLNLYKTGQLDENTQKQLEADIEKQEAIGEYLYENGDIPDLDDLGADFDIPPEAASETRQEAEFTALIRSSIRRAFVKMGLCVGSVLLVIILFVIFVLPKAVSCFYYNPGEIVESKPAQSNLSEDDYNPQITRMQLDLLVCSELFIPGAPPFDVISEDMGYGEYALTIPQVMSYTDSFTTVNGRLERNKLTLYNPDYFRLPTGNAFIPPENTESHFLHSMNGEPIGPAGSKEEAFQKLETLEDKWYQAYISLENLASYEEFSKWIENLKKELELGGYWCGVYLPYVENTGFSPTASGCCINWDRETYPNLSLLDAQSDNSPDDYTARTMETHFLSMLKYMEDYPQLAKMMNINTPSYENSASYIEEHGMQIYGFSVTAKKNALLELSKKAEVSYIYTTPAR